MSPEHKKQMEALMEQMRGMMKMMEGMMAPMEEEMPEKPPMEEVVDESDYGPRPLKSSL